MEKTHYRKVFKSDHLGVADLEEMLEEGKQLIFTVKQVKQEYGAKVAGRTIDANIAYFQENIKPMVLNAGNSKVMRSFANKSPFVELKISKAADSSTTEVPIPTWPDVLKLETTRTIILYMIFFIFYFSLLFHHQIS